MLPFPALNPCSNLRGRFLLLRLFVGIDSFPNADIANGSMLAGEAIEQTPMPDAAIAMAIARLLIENAFHFGRKGVCILYDGVFE